MTEKNTFIVAPERTRTEYVTKNVTITEHRAPTDESVKLLREMEAKAEAEVVKAVHVENNGFECVVHHWRDNLSDADLWRAVFKLNGRQMTADIQVPRPPEQQDHKAVFEKLRDEMAKVIAAQVLNEAFIRTVHARTA